LSNLHISELVKLQADTESALLGALFHSEDRAAAVETITASLGSNGWTAPYGYIWDAIRGLVKQAKPSDVTAVRQELVRLGQLDLVGGVERLGKIVDEVPSFDVVRWVTDLTKTRGRIKGLGLTDEIKTKILRGEQIDEHVEKLFATAAESEEKKPKPAGWREAMRCLPTPWSELVGLVDEPVPYVIWPLAVQGSLTQVQGLPKSGKSAFDVLLGVCAATQTWPYPQYLRADKPLKVLYIAWEDPKLMMSKRASLYARGLGLAKTFSNDNLVFMFGPSLFVDEASGETTLKQAITELQPDLVVVDTLSHIHHAEENSSSEMKMPMMALDRVAKETNVSIIYLHHTNKGSGEGKATQNKGRGSGAIAAAWHVLVDWGEREEGSNVNPITIISKFEHNEIRWNVTYNAIKDENNVVDKVEWVIEGREDERREEKAGSTAVKLDRIIKASQQLAVQGDGWFTVAQMVTACGLGLDEQSIKRHLQRLCESGWLEFKPGKAPVPHHYKAILRGKGNLE
jgi:hypothetical protein